MAVDPLRPGDPEAVGEFRIVGRLGQGGQGIVYLGESPGSGQAAVKVMTGGIDRAFARELAAARMVDEFCTARVLVADLDHDPPYVAAEYIDGPALATAGPVRGAALTRLAIGTVTALAAIHRAGVVHRDFKPGNVLLGPDGPRVIDFGIARLVDATATAGSSSGTPPYMSPEQLSGDTVGPAADLFAWGSTMAFAATGEPPFGRDTFAAVAYRILHGEPALGGLPEPLRGIVARCLAKDPSARPSARTVLLELLGEPSDPPGASAAPAPAPESQAPDDRAGGADAAGDQAREAGPAGGGEAGAGAGERELRELSRGARAAAGGGRGRVSRRALLLGAGAVAGAVAVSGGVLWWRSAQSPASGGRVAGPDTAGSPEVSGSVTSTAPAGSATPAAQDRSPSATATAERTIVPPRPEGQDIVIAMQSAITVKPMADLTFDGALTQSEFAAKAHGRIRFHPEVSFSPQNCAYAMTVTPAGEPEMDVTMVLSEGSAELFVDGKPQGEREPRGQDYLDMVVTMSGIGVILDLVGRTERVDAAGPRYSGSLPAEKAPGAIQEQLAGMAGWKTSELEGTRINWQLELDRQNRPRIFVLSWVTEVRGTELASTYSTTFGDWRQGEIAAPG
ncbi:serine/threonine-protein kinase [Nonomuraea sp. B1E8]|uniref:serine/threonine-protein kinase n=1 Tax=unclassified Nonomuraea TaxID=2593643 RepID=UPI00325C5A8F